MCKHNSSDTFLIPFYPAAAIRRTVLKIFLLALQDYFFKTTFTPYTHTLTIYVRLLGFTFKQLTLWYSNKIMNFSIISCELSPFLTRKKKQQHGDKIPPTNKRLALHGEAKIPSSTSNRAATTQPSGGFWVCAKHPSPFPPRLCRRGPNGWLLGDPRAQLEAALFAAYVCSAK